MAFSARLSTFVSNNWKYIVLALLMYMPLFGNLDGLPLRDHDEGLNSINALEMYRDGDWIVMHHDSRPDMYNTKPPLLMWTQVAFMHVVGVNTLAVRLPSAFAGFFTCVVILFFSVRYFRNEWLGIITVLALITTNGYIHSHVTRTADFDALLTLFTTVACMWFYLYCETQRPRHLYLFFLALSCAVLTKGIAGLMFVPALLLYALIRKRALQMLKSQHFYLGALIFLFLAVGYYLLRESRNPGYLRAVYMNEIGGRYLENPGNKPDDFWFYFNALTTYQMPDRFLLIPCGLLIGLFSRDERIKWFSALAALLIFLYFLIISASATRMEQYVAPLFPFMAWMVGLTAETVFRWIRSSQWLASQTTRNIFPFLFLFLVSANPYKKIWWKTYTPAENHIWDKEFYEIGHFYKDALKGRIDLNGKALLYDGWNPHIKFYVYALQEKGVQTSLVRQTQDLRPGDLIVAYQPAMKRLLRDWFVCEEIPVRGNVSYFRLLRRC